MSLALLLPAVPSASAEVAPHGEVVCERVGQRSVLTLVRSTDPLKLLTPRTHGPAAQAVMSSYGGGLLGGDRVRVTLNVKTGATLALTTQSAGKVYRTEGPAAGQTLGATVGDGASLAVLPDPVCAFSGSRFEQCQTFDLADSANLVWLDWLTSGRHARGERWAMTSLRSRTTVRVGGRVRLTETLSLDSADGPIASVMRTGRFNTYAVLAAFGPDVRPLIDAARAAVRAVDLSRIDLLAADAAADGGAVFRVLGPDVQAVRSLLVRMLAPLAGLIGHDPWARKW